VALGVPLGSLIGANLGWRVTFFGVAVLALLAFAGLLLGMAKEIGKRLAGLMGS
jgi:DHA1 family purine base/nucleoside efflux pump-like MFS transporter